ncbi:hypothetical protein DFJ73DRAFT_959331 [Zopfochytrium polystomum]|nr:hypothetical protein DFJ73DRAFT_959331 [Zopfochytrium polystomum]
MRFQSAVAAAAAASAATLLLLALPAAVIAQDPAAAAAGGLPPCLALPIPPTTPALPFSTLVVFGASYADDGARNGAPAAAMAPALDPLGAKQFTGRNSNGPTFAEFLAGPTGLFQDASAAAAAGTCQTGLLNARLVDMAYSGATCDNKIFGKPDPTAAPFSVVQQVQMALANVLPTVDLATTLFLFLPATQDISGIIANPATSAAVAACYQSSIAALAAAGAKHFMLGTMYPFDMAPQNAGQSAAAIANIQSLIATFNQQLIAVPAAVKAAFPASANVWVFDANYAVAGFLAPNAALLYGAGANVKDACSAAGTASAACQAAGTDSFLWWDVHHPTRQTHNYFAELMFYYLSGQPVTGAIV